MEIIWKSYGNHMDMCVFGGDLFHKHRLPRSPEWKVKTTSPSPVGLTCEQATPIRWLGLEAWPPWQIWQYLSNGSLTKEESEIWPHHFEPEVRVQAVLHSDPEKLPGQPWPQYVAALPSLASLFRSQTHRPYPASHLPRLPVVYCSPQKCL